MPWLFWTEKDPQIDAFAQQLANHFYSMLPPRLAEQALAGAERRVASTGKRTAKAADPNIERVVTDAIQQLSGFTTRQGLGLYGKARLHMQFRTRLVALGYSKDEARGIVQMLLLGGA